MNELQVALKTFAIEMLAALQSGLDLVKGELPSFVQEALRFWTIQTLYGAIVAFVTTILLGLGCWIFARKSFDIAHYYDIKDSKKRDRYESYNNLDFEVLFGALSSIFGLIAIILTLVFFIQILPTTIKAFTAPKLFLIEKLIELVR